MNSFRPNRSFASSLKKHAKPGLDTKNMEIYDLKDPKIIKSKKIDSRIFYTMQTKAGITIRTYIIGWENSKIVSIEDKGFKKRF